MIITVKDGILGFRCKNSSMDDDVDDDTYDKIDVLTEMFRNSMIYKKLFMMKLHAEEGENKYSGGLPEGYAWATTANPASRWKSMWQWRNHGPGLSVWKRIVTLSPACGVPVSTTSRQIGSS